MTSQHLFVTFVLVMSLVVCAFDKFAQHSTNSNWNLGSIWICTKKFEFLDLVIHVMNQKHQNKSINVLCCTKVWFIHILDVWLYVFFDVMCFLMNSSDIKQHIQSVKHQTTHDCTAQEWSNRTVAEHACSKMWILRFTKTKRVQ